MSDHPYAGPETLTPGETADDDPHGGGEYCPECDEDVDMIGDECPFCGMRLK